MKNKFESNSEEGIMPEKNLAKQSGLESEEISHKILFPHGEFGIKSYEKEYGNDPKEIEKVRNIFDTFLSQEVANVTLYKSEKYDVTFPYTRINIKDFAKALYEKYGEANKEYKVRENEQKHIDREFIFPGAPLNPKMLDNGPFHFVGESLHQCVEKLPAALEKMKNGEEPDEFEIFMLGTPINELGTVSPEFLENFKKDPTVAMSDVFVEFIEKNGTAKDNPNDKLDIELYGISWGGGTAAITGEKLLETGAFTQDSQKSKEENLAKITIRAQNPVSLSRSKIKGPQIWLGAPTNNLISKDQYAPAMGKAMPEFMNQVDVALEKRGIHKDMSADQQKMKKSGMLAVLLSFRKGVKLKPETKVNEIYGLQDLTTKASSMTREAREQLETHGGSLGQNLLKPQRENSRVFGVNTFHEIPWFRENELRRIRKAVMELGKL
jgi:hypothetical protein